MAAPYRLESARSGEDNLLVTEVDGKAGVELRTPQLRLRTTSRVPRTRRRAAGQRLVGALRAHARRAAPAARPSPARRAGGGRRAGNLVVAMDTVEPVRRVDRGRLYLPHRRASGGGGRGARARADVPGGAVLHLAVGEPAGRGGGRQGARPPAASASSPVTIAGPALQSSASCCCRCCGVSCDSRSIRSSRAGGSSGRRATWRQTSSRKCPRPPWRWRRRPWRRRRRCVQTAERVAEGGGRRGRPARGIHRHHRRAPDRAALRPRHAAADRTRHPLLELPHVRVFLVRPGRAG